MGEIREFEMRMEGARNFLRIRNENLSRLLSIYGSDSRESTVFSSTRSGCPPLVALLATDQ